jgi:hypothetical protein
MPLVPTNYPDLIAARGVPVNVVDGWESRGSSADHVAVVLHHTASSDKESPSSCANYCFLGAEYAPDYNVLVDRTGVAWVGAREKSNSSGDISSVALNEALRGEASCVSAGQRGLGDDTSANSKLFAISAQNNGVGETWGDDLVYGINVCAAVALECLGLAHAGYVTQHRVLTARKIDNCGGNCPYDFQPGINEVLRGGGATPQPEPEEPEMWTIVAEVPAGTGRDDVGALTLALPANRKSARLQMYCACDPKEGVSLWAAQCLNGKKFGMWSKGNTWEQWLTGSKPFDVDLMPEAYAISFQHMGGTKAPLTVSVSGT